MGYVPPDIFPDFEKAFKTWDEIKPNAIEGQLFYNTDEDKYKRFTNGEWVEMSAKVVNKKRWLTGNGNIELAKFLMNGGTIAGFKYNTIVLIAIEPPSNRVCGMLTKPILDDGKAYFTFVKQSRGPSIYSTNSLPVELPEQYSFRKDWFIVYVNGMRADFKAIRISDYTDYLKIPSQWRLQLNDDVLMTQMTKITPRRVAKAVADSVVQRTMKSVMAEKLANDFDKKIMLGIDESTSASKSTEAVLSKEAIDEVFDKFKTLPKSEILNYYSSGIFSSIYDDSEDLPEFEEEKKSKLQQALDDVGLSEEDAVNYIKSMKVAKRIKRQKKAKKQSVKDRQILI